MAVADKVINWVVSNPPASALAAAALDPTFLAGQFKAFTTSGLTQSLITGGDADDILSYCRRGNYRQNSSELRFYGATHSGGNRNRLIRCLDSANAWTLVEENTPFGGGQPHHGYYHYTVAPDGTEFEREYGGNPQLHISRRLPGGSWVPITNITDAGQFNVANAIEWMPNLNGGLGGLVHCSQNYLQTWHPTTGIWTVRHSTMLNGDYHNWSALNRSDGCVYCGGGNSSSKMWRVNADGSVTQRADTPFVISLGDGDDGTVFPGASGKLYAFAEGGGFSQYDNVANAWSGISGSLPFSAFQNKFVTMTVDPLAVVVILWLSSPNTPSNTLYLYKR